MEGLMGAAKDAMGGGEAPPYDPAEAEAAINAEKYRVKGKQCTPTNPADCTARYNQMLDPRAGRTKEELAAMDRRDAKELSMLETMLSDVKYESTGKGK